MKKVGDTFSSLLFLLSFACMLEGRPEEDKAKFPEEQIKEALLEEHKKNPYRFVLPPPLESMRARLFSEACLFEEYEELERVFEENVERWFVERGERLVHSMIMKRIAKAAFIFFGFIVFVLFSHRSALNLLKTLYTFLDPFGFEKNKRPVSEKMFLTNVIFALIEKFNFWEIIVRSGVPDNKDVFKIHLNDLIETFEPVYHVFCSFMIVYALHKLYPIAIYITKQCLDILELCMLDIQDRDFMTDLELLYLRSIYLFPENKRKKIGALIRQIRQMEDKDLLMNAIDLIAAVRAQPHGWASVNADISSIDEHFAYYPQVLKDLARRMLVGLMVKDIDKVGRFQKLLVGPPGIGKSHLGRLLGEYEGIDVIYVPASGGSLVERIIVALRTAAALKENGRLYKNVVFVFEEFDKDQTGSGEKHVVLDPSSEILGVIKVGALSYSISVFVPGFVIATANDINLLQDSLQDRFHIIKLPPIPKETKMHILNDVIIPKYMRSLEERMDEYAIDLVKGEEVLKKKLVEFLEDDQSYGMRALEREAEAVILDILQPYVVKKSKSRKRKRRAKAKPM